MAKKGMNESDTRFQLIDDKLIGAGWSKAQIKTEQLTPGRLNVKDGSRGVPKRIDYLLRYRDKSPLAVVEAKAEHKDAGDGLSQAIEYGHQMKVPFVYATNGHDCIEYDMNSGIASERFALSEFPSPEQLMKRKMVNLEILDDGLDLINRPFYNDPKDDRSPRYYQYTSVNRIVEAIAQGKKRAMVVMATGVGKTYTAVQLTYKLKGTKLFGREVQKILFLADRNALLDDPYEEFKRIWGNNVSKIENRRIDKSVDIHLGIYQQMSLGEKDENSVEGADMNVFHQVPSNYYDLIIIDECHRGGVRDDSAWREVLEYYHTAIQVGLTATPKVEEGADNYLYFGEPVYSYSLKDGILDGFLAPYQVVRYYMDIDDGLTKKQALSRKEREELREEVEMRRQEQVAKQVAKHLRETGELQKTIIFCKTTKEAGRMRELLMAEFPERNKQFNGSYVERITSEETNKVALLKEFKKETSSKPTIVTTSKLLTTGVNIPTCKVVVIDANIESMSEFKQIIGRGTRVSEKHEKHKFDILDFRGVSKHFDDKNFDGLPIREYEKKLDIDGREMESIETEYTSEYPELNEGDAVQEFLEGYVRNYRGVSVRIIGKDVYFIDADGNTIRGTHEEFLKSEWKKNVHENLGDMYLDFLEKGGRARLERAREEYGELIEETLKQSKIPANEDYDLFETMAHLVFDKTPKTRKDKVFSVKKNPAYYKMNQNQRKFFDVVLMNYQSGVDDSFGLLTVSRMPQLNEVFSEGFIHLRESLFGSKSKMIESLKKLEFQLHQC